MRGLSSSRQEGGSDGRGLGLGAQQSPRCLSGQGKHWPVPFCSFSPLPHHLPHHHWTPNRGWVLLGVGTSSLPQPPLSHASPGPAFTFAPPALLPTPSGPVRAGGGFGGQRIRPGNSTGSWGSKWAGETWPRLPFDPLPSQWFPVSPFGGGIPSRPPAAPQGHQSLPLSTSPPDSLPPHPMSYPVARGSSHPLRCLWSSTGAW